MRNPDSLNVGEPGCKENSEHQHPNRLSLDRASDLDHDRAWWRAEARRIGSDWPSVVALLLAMVAPLAAAMGVSAACDICGTHTCINPSFCDHCRKADARLRAETRKRPGPIPHDWDQISVQASWHALNDERQRSTPQSTIEAIMHCVRTRGAKVLHEPANLERLSRCDDAALAQIDARVARLKESGQCQ